MRLFQNLLITYNSRCFESLFLSWKTSLIVSKWAWAWQSSWFHLRKCSSSTNFTILISCSPVCISWSPTFNPMSLSLKWATTLVAAICRNMERGNSCKITNMIRVNGSERRPFIFIFRLNIVPCDSHHADEIIMEIEKWKPRVPDDYVKSFSRVLLGVLETSILS